MPGRLLITALVVLLLVGLVSAIWNLCGWPPPRLILKYGFPPTGGPTGRTMTIEGVEFVELKPGYFRMGSHFLCQKGDLLGRIGALLHLPRGKQPKHDSYECPPHWVEIQDPFWCALTEVTNEQYGRFDSAHQRVIAAASAAVVLVAWEDARAYCEWLTKRGDLVVRLPSEAEWEYACRAGLRTEYCFGDDESKLGEYAWFGALYDAPEHAVKGKRPNSWGLFDLHGNVWEWCEDTYHTDYTGAPQDARPWTEGGAPGRVVRGGSWFSPAVACRSAFRGGYGPSVREYYLGLRLIMSSR